MKKPNFDDLFKDMTPEMQKLLKDAELLRARKEGADLENDGVPMPPDYKSKEPQDGDDNPLQQDDPHDEL